MDKLIIYGGTFNPIHNGHLKFADTINKILDSPIYFMPNIIPPYKVMPTITNQQRLDMLQLAIKDNPNFAINTLELAANNYYYSQKTLTLLRLQYGDMIPFYFIIGLDSLISLSTWNFYQDIFDLTNLIVVNRHNFDYNDITDVNLRKEIATRRVDNFNDQTTTHGIIYFLPEEITADISSTKIRAKVKAGESISNLVPPAVEQYIKSHNLYLD
jgi:nicotinate-nucleotide adenylyltransferase